MPAITGVEFRRFTANHHNAQRNWLLVKLNTDDPSVYGIGDASPMEDDVLVMGMIERMVEKHLIGKDPLETEVHWTNLYQDFQARGGRIASTAISGIDIALWDLKGRILDQPVWKLLGGAHRRSIRVYANGWYSNPGTAEQNAEEAKIVVGMGYTALKFDPFGQHNYYKLSLKEAQLAEDRVAAVRQAVGPNVDILVEAHAKFDVMNAIQIGKRLEEYRPLFYEEPVSQERVSELLEVRNKVNIPIATGERLYTKFPFAEIVDRHAADVLQPDIANAGGITELKKIAIIAEAKHITMAPHNVCSPVGAMAEMHLDASIINFEIQEYHAEFYTEHYFTVLDGFPRQKDGYVELSDAPGLGLELNEAEIAAHPPLAKTTSAGGTVRGI
ncbi:MAG: mandelate racemase/muconate lactonizing enzyme family protein [Chloroflexi bacterium]|mgnify:FL=1|jgi:galactonate dehydratase|nr:mandelate racemase/muconate lactonizing enzyme family protein [Chloroflexota bacterium]MDA1282530.1 mandelate racemase/muconate lactonizing enzyme family protein [Chloroflexota bacterium]|tara:strand:+ start:229 stop:1386 length:1158 start_codon:yes stop_codon:yes gene_type:complete